MAVELNPDERDHVFGVQAARVPQFAKYEAGTDRVIPVIEIV
jgi:hypothetical protein